MARATAAGSALAGWVSLAAGDGIHVDVGAGLMWLFPRELAGLFLDAAQPDSGHVLDLAVSFLTVAALFQLFDGAQVVGSAMLRGLQDTKRADGVRGVRLLGGRAWRRLLCSPSGAAGGAWVSGSASPLGLGVVAVLMIGRWSLRDRLGLVAAA